MSTERAERLKNLSPAKRALLLKAMRRAAVHESEVNDIIPRRSNQEPQQLSYAQQRLWLLDQLMPGSAAYNIPTAMRLTGQLYTSALRRSVAEVVRRHESLRTRFVQIEGQPMQVVTAPADALMPLIDLSGLTAEERNAETHRLATQEATRSFDLSAGPLLRVHLLRLAAEEHVVLLTMHHIISDGWSMNVLIQEISTLYTAYSEGAASPLAELPVQYADYAHWQRQHLSGATLDEQLNYWTRQLTGAAVLELPTDRPRPAVQSYRGANISHALSPELSEQLQQLSRREGATLFMTLLAAWQVLLMRYSGQSDISVGTPVAGRTRAEVEPLIGFFINTLVLRTEMDGATSFRETLARVREVCLGGYAHQEVPFEMLVEQLQPERSLSHSPLFQVMFILQNTPRREINLSTLSLTPVESSNRTAKFDLTLEIWEEDEKIVLMIEYNTDLYDEETVRRMLGHYERLLTSIVSDPQQRLAELALLSSEEQHQLLVEWNQTAQDFPPLCIHQLFAQQVQQTPDAIALIFDEQRLSYLELNRRANQLAHLLQHRGVGADVLVAVMVERSIEMVVALLAILKAGGAFLPLDPSYPQERLSFMLEDAGVELLLTQHHLVAELSPHRAAIVLLDGDVAEMGQRSSENPPSRVTPENLAYVVYTSGSTGQPKGVGNTHRGAVNRFHWMWQRYPFAPGEVCCQKTSLSFADSVWEVFGPLLAGIPSVLIAREDVVDARRLAQRIEEHGVSRLVAVPSLLRAILESEEGVERRLGSLRYVVSSGEALGRELAREWKERVGGSELLNLYGSSEVSADATSEEVRGVESGGGGVKIGKPIGNTEVYVMNGEMRVVPVGVMGELYVGGVGLARGYKGRGEQTAERFVPHPYAREAGARLYRTGDMVRWLSDGTLEYIGRADYQVKVRGYRIELGEIEAVVTAHAGVREAVVVARDEASGEGKRLICYCVQEEGAEVSAAELREHVRERLPEYMVPSAIVMLAEIPLTPNGKVNRKVLPAPEDVAGEREQEYVAARTPVEELLASMWREVLGVEQVGIRDNFFSLGGHSLKATQVLSRIHKSFNVQVSLREFFHSPTIEGLSGLISSEKRIDFIEIELVAEQPFYDLSHAQKRLWVTCQSEESSVAHNLAGAFVLEGKLKPGVLESALRTLVERHESLRTSFVVVNGQPKQRIREDSLFALERFDFSGDEDGEALARELANVENRMPFDLEAAPLLRAKLVKLDAEKYVFLLTIHHIVSDGWSMSVLVKEMLALYRSYAQGGENSLAPLRIQYKDFAGWQNEQLSGTSLTEHRQYWSDKLAGELPPLNLPFDYPRPPAQTFNGDNFDFEIDGEVTAGLQSIGRESGASLFMVLLASVYALLHRYTGQDDIVLGSPVAGRDHADLEDQIGFYVNMLALRIAVGGDDAFTDLLGQVRHTTLEAYEHQVYPFDLLVRDLNVRRDGSRAPLADVGLTLQNQFSDQPDDLNLEFQIRPFEQKSTTAKTDLWFYFSEFNGRISGTINYNTDLFRRETISLMSERLSRLLQQVVGAPETKIMDVDFFDESVNAEDIEEIDVELAF